MGLPEGSLAMVLLIVIAVPGFIHSAIRRWARGESVSDRDLGLSIARGTVFAITLSCVYLVGFGNLVLVGLAAGSDVDTVTMTNPRAVALTVLVLYVIFPALVALALNLQHIEWATSQHFGWLRLPRSRHAYNSFPSAWDRAAQRNQHAWIKIRRPNGEWVGGWFTKGSFSTTYPEERALYIDQQWSMSADGNFIVPIANTGIYVAIGDEDVVIWTRQPQPEKTAEDHL